MKELLLDALYAGGLAAASPYFIYKMAASGKYRTGISQRLGFVEPRGGGPCIWVHGVSVGEILAARGIIAGLERDLPGVELVVSTTTNTGYAVAQKTYPGKRVFYFPLDFSRAVARTFRRIRPRMVVLMELEVWPNFMRRAERLGVPVVVVNGRITDRSFKRFDRFRALASGTLRRVTRYLVQTGRYRDRLTALGVPAERVDVAGNIKFDTLSTDVDDARAAALRREMGVAPGEFLVIGGSTHDTEETALLDAYADLKKRDPRVRLIIVPRHKERFEEVARVIRSSGAPLARRSALAASGVPPSDAVILGDTMGELESLYEAADVAFVGGSLIDHGGQNMSEPAAKGRPVVFGPSVHNFPDTAPLLLDAGAATQVRSAAELADALAGYLDPARAAAAGRAGRDAVIKARGATAATLERLKRLYLETERK